MATVIKPKRTETALAIPSSGSLEAGELAMNVTDGKFYTKTSGGVVKEIGGAGAVTLNSVTTAGASTTTSILLDQGANLIFEGNLANAYETTLTVTEPTADRTITLPNATGTVEIGNIMEFIAGEGVNTSASGNQLTIAGELASTSNIGVASFSSDNFTVSSGDVTVTTIDGGSF